MWRSDKWIDFEVIDCNDGEKLERWGDYTLVRPDPQAIWETDHRNRAWQRANARYSRSSTGGGHWDKNKLPEQWQVEYGKLTFNGGEFSYVRLLGSGAGKGVTVNGGIFKTIYLTILCKCGIII